MANVTKRGDTYKITVFLGKDENGKQIRRCDTFRPAPGMKKRDAEKAAQKYADKFEERIKAELNPKTDINDPDITFAVYARKVLDTKHAFGKLTEKTFDRDNEMLRRICESIGSKPLCEITSADIAQMCVDLAKGCGEYEPSYAVATEQFYLAVAGMKKTAIAEKAGVSFTTVARAVQSERITISAARKISGAFGKNVDDLFRPIIAERKGLAPKTVREHCMLVSSVYSKALDNGYVQKNPAKAVLKELTTDGQREIMVLSAEELRRIAQCLKNEPIMWQALIMLMMVTGYRRGNIVGIKDRNVDFEHGTIHMKSTVLSVHGKKYEKNTSKTKNSHKVLAVPHEIMQLIENWMAERDCQEKAVGDRWNDTGYLFVGEYGEPLHPDSINKYLDRFSAKYDLPHLHPHQFRHSVASHLLYEGLDLKTVADAIGDTGATVAMTYAHAINNSSAIAGKMMADIIADKTAE